MTTIYTEQSMLGIKFRSNGQLYYFISNGLETKLGDYVVVETDQGLGMGMVAQVCGERPEHLEADEVKPIVRIATEEDLSSQGENEALAKEAFAYCRTCIKERELDMKLVDVEVFFDRSKIIFYFTAPTRIDFRELVKDLVKNYRTRIELRQIGVRHETQMVGALGNCGMVCCCRRYLRKFAPVTIKMAKEQNLFLNPNKISGMCGRLLCCLNYEQSNYEEFHRRCPKMGKKFITTIGPVKVIRANIFRNALTLLLETNEEKEVSLEEWYDLHPRRPEQVQVVEQTKMPVEESQIQTDEGSAEEAAEESFKEFRKKPDQESSPENAKESRPEARREKREQPVSENRQERRKEPRSEAPRKETKTLIFLPPPEELEDDLDLLEDQNNSTESEPVSQGQMAQLEGEKKPQQQRRQGKSRRRRKRKPKSKS